MDNIEVTTINSRRYRLRVRVFGTAVRKGYSFLTARILARLAVRSIRPDETVDDAVARMVPDRKQTVRAFANSL